MPHYEQDLGSVTLSSDAQESCHRTHVECTVGIMIKTADECVRNTE